MFEPSRLPLYLTWLASLAMFALAALAIPTYGFQNGFTFAVQSASLGAGFALSYHIGLWLGRH